jgi:hypothetical protein
MAKTPTRAAKDALSELVDKAIADSIGAIDHATNAKAIALANKEVQAAIRALLDRDYQLVAIQPLRGFGSSLMSFPLGFTFRPGADAGPVALNESFVVLVELPTRSVKRISPSAELAEGADVPFAVAANARFTPPVTPLADDAARRAREAAYYADIGLGGMGGYPSAAGTDETATLRVDNAPTSSDVETITYSDNVADDSASDPSNHDDSEEKYRWVADHGDDQSSGDPWQGGFPGGPGGGWPGGGRPRPGGGWPWPDPRPPYGWRNRR